MNPQSELIAEMLIALKTFIAALDNMSHDQITEAIRLARAAIQKAEGTK